MLRGHVDLISETEVSGWAIDDDNPDAPIEVVIYVDDLRAASALCDIPRPERRNVGVAGPATNCFVHKFPEPLPIQQRPHRVTVRFAPNGGLLGAGDAILPRNAPQKPADLNARLPPSYFQLPAPMTPRALFEVLALYDPRQGLYTLLNQVDFTVAAVHGVDYAALLHVAMPPPPPGPWTAQTVKDRLYDTLVAPGFQQHVMVQLLKAYPEKQRCLFVHIPKCAGSDLSFNLQRRYPAIDRQITNPASRPRAVLFDEIARTIRQFRFSPEVFVRGHVNLGYYESTGLIRPTDQVFTIMRDPIGIAISHVNYILTRFRNDARSKRAGLDTKGWLRVLGLPFDPDALSTMDVTALALRILRDKRIVLHNPMCHWLGGGDADTVLDRLARHGVEVTDTRHYEAWLASRWEIGSSDRRNESVKFIAQDGLAPEDLAYLHASNQQDERLFRIVTDRLRDAGTPSVRIGRAKAEKVS